jgi:hypothetical protein
MIRSTLAALTLISLPFATPSPAACISLAERLAAAEQRDDLLLFLPPLCAYLESELPPAAFERIRGAQSAAEFRGALAAAAGRDVFDFGEAMLAHYDRNATLSDAAQPMESVESEHFVFVFSADAPAARDIEVVARTAEEIWRNIAELLDIGGELEASRRITATRVERGGGAAATRHDGKIPVYLHTHRRSASRIPTSSYGIAQLGATILDGEEASLSGTPRLTSRIDVLYLNSFSLIVLHHEIAHAVMLLGSFDARALEGRTVEGKGELKKAFFAGYRKTPVFLHEAIGDYAFYYRGFHSVWPLLVGTPEQIVSRLRDEGKYIPLASLLRQGKRFRAANHKSYSLQAAAFVDFLATTRGEAKMRQWLFSGEKNGARSFARVYGSPLGVVEKEWLAWIAARAQTAEAAGGGST